ncbi:MAG: hypothetical protein ACKVZ0_21935 [Gemmatimonadales bacterium]
MPRALLLGVCLLALHSPPARSQGGAAIAPDSPAAPRNPTALNASEVLTRRGPGIAPRVRFEWDPVPGVAEYRLEGAWTEPRTWTFRTLGFRVTRQTAQEWNGQRIAVEVTLPPGAHSWKVVSLYGPNAIGDFTRPTQVSFDLND